MVCYYKEAFGLGAISAFIVSVIIILFQDIIETIFKRTQNNLK